MYCSQCNRNLILCICPDAEWDARIAELEKSPYLAMDWGAIRAQRLLAKFEIERDRQNDKETEEIGKQR